MKSSFRKFYGYHHDLVNRCRKRPRICSVSRNHNPVLSLFMTYHRMFKKSNTTGVTCGADPAYPPGATEFTPEFYWISCCSIFSFLCNVLYIVVFPFSFGHCVVWPFEMFRILPETIKNTENYEWTFSGKLKGGVFLTGKKFIRNSQYFLLLQTKFGTSRKAPRGRAYTACVISTKINQNVDDSECCQG